MTRTTVAEFANELKKSTDTLLEQLRSAGVPKADAADVLTDADKQKLLGYLQASHGTGTPERKKITLVKKSTSEIKQADATGKARTIQVEVRKKRTFIQRDEPEAEVVKSEPVASVPVAPLIDDAELARREEEARRQAELIRRQEEELAEKRRLRQEQEEREQAEAQARAEQAAADAARAKAAADAAPSDSPADTQAVADKAEAPATPPQPTVDPAVAAAIAEQERKAAASKASAEEDAARAKDLEDRRRKALAEAEAIRAMMNAPKRVLVAKKPEEPAKPADAKPIKGTLHKPATPAGAAAGAARPAGATTTGKDGKEVKSAKLSSSWADDQAKKKEIKTRGDTSAGVGRNSWRGGPKGRRERDREEVAQPAQPVENRVIEVHVPETITVAELAHKMAVKASEVIKHLMKLGQMVTINQPLDQDTAMIVVEEMGHKAIVAALDDPEAFTEEEASAHTAESVARAPVVTVMGHVDHGNLLARLYSPRQSGGRRSRCHYPAHWGLPR